MSARHKVLLLDDDQDLLELYREMLARLPSQPEIHTATSGARAISLLESEPFSLLISDLNMPKMDGLQVLTIVRRKFPQLRTAVMTSVVDAQFRTRAYAMGIDLFLEKPNTSQEITFFLDCIESLLGREMDGGFRGVQSKSLVDIIQLECLSQSSSVLKVTNGSLTGKVWFKNGDLIDAATQDLTGEIAFHKILSWNTGNFEILQAEPLLPEHILLDDGADLPPRPIGDLHPRLDDLPRPDQLAHLGPRRVVHGQPVGHELVEVAEQAQGLLGAALTDLLHPCHPHALPRVMTNSAGRPGASVGNRNSDRRARSNSA